MDLNMSGNAFTMPTLIAGSEIPIRTEMITIKEGEAADLAIGTPMIMDRGLDGVLGALVPTDGKFIQFDPGATFDVANGTKHENIGIEAVLAMVAGDPTEGDVQCLAYVSGTFNIDLVLGLVKNFGSDPASDAERVLIKSQSKNNNIYLEPVNEVY